MNIINIFPDLNIESSKNYKKLRELLKGADYLIDENGLVFAWGAASFQLNCKSMDFSNYPYDKHKCEFFVRSDFYHQVITGRSAEAGLELTLSLTQLVSKRQMSLLMASNAKSAQSKDV